MTCWCKLAVIISSRFFVIIYLYFSEKYIFFTLFLYSRMFAIRRSWAVWYRQISRSRLIRNIHASACNAHNWFSWRIFKLVCILWFFICRYYEFVLFNCSIILIAFGIRHTLTTRQPRHWMQLASQACASFCNHGNVSCSQNLDSICIRLLLKMKMLIFKNITLTGIKIKYLLFFLNK